MIVNKNIEIKKSIGNKNKYIMDCINPDCKEKVFVIQSKFINKQDQSGQRYFACCEKCSSCEYAMNIQKENIKEKYGVDNVWKLDSVRETTRHTNKSRYGVENIFQSEEIKIKINEKLSIKDENGISKRTKMGQRAYQTKILILGKENMIGAVSKNSYEKTCSEKYGSPKYFSSEIGRMNLNGYILRYGNRDGLEKYLEKNKKCGITLENLQKKYGFEEGERKYLDWKNKVSITLSKMIEKYGLEEGTNKYEKWYFSSIGIISSGQVSKISKLFFTELEKYCNLSFKDCHEKYFFDKINNKRYFVDLKLNNKIIEFNGDYWHANPKIYHDEDIIKLKGNQVLTYAKEIREKDERKISFLRNLNNEIMIIWEKDYRENNVDFEKIRRFLID